MSSRPPFPAPIPAVLTVIGTVLVGLHALVWWRLVHGAGLALGPEVAVTFGLGLAGAATWASFLGRFLRLSFPGAVVTFGWSWLGLLFLGASTVLVTEPVRWLFPDVDPWAARGLVVALGVVGSYAANTARRPAVLEVDLPVRGLPPAFSGFRIAQISDVHVGHTSRAFLASVVDVVNRADVDLVAITGDLVEGTVAEVGADTACLADLRSRHGTFFVTGNHEYYSGADAWVEHLRGLGLRVLRNEWAPIRRGDDVFALVGVDDKYGHLVPGHGFDLDRALDGVPAGTPRVLLSHQPVTVDAAADRGVEAQLSGHTHGGQLFPFHFLVRLQQPYLAGLVNHRGTSLYVHRGTGHWGPPLRLGATGEIALLTLRPA